MQHSQSGLPTCRHCSWVFTSWPSFCMYFERARCPVLHKDVSVTLPPGSTCKNTPMDIPNLPTCPNELDTAQALTARGQALVSVVPEPGAAKPFASTPLSPTRSDAGPHLDSDPEPVVLHPCNSDRPPAPQTSTPVTPAHPSGAVKDVTSRYPYLPEQLCAVAVAADWQHLARLIKNTDYHHCMLCGQWLAHPGYLSRHVKAQHAEAFVFHSAVLKWLEGRTTSILSPCQFCGTDFKVRKCSRPRHARECPVLYRAGLLLRLCASYTVPAAVRTLSTVHVNDCATGHGVAHEGRPSPGNPGCDQPGNPGSSRSGEPPLGHDAQVGRSPRQASPERSWSGQHRTEHTISTPERSGGRDDAGTRAGAHGDPKGTRGQRRVPTRRARAMEIRRNGPSPPPKAMPGHPTLAGSGITAKPPTDVEELRTVPGGAETGRTIRDDRIATGGATRTGTATRTRPS